MKLGIELVPRTSWCANLRSILPRKQWDKLRRECYRKAKYRCEICNDVGPDHPVECHEIWSYDDDRHTQTLVGLIALCPACHEVKHFGLACVRRRSTQAREHLMRVNGWSIMRVRQHISEAFEKWRLRSEYQWEVDISWAKS